MLYSESAKLMRRLLVIVLLTAFIPVSLLGYAGFAVLGIHSHCDCHCSSEYGPSSQTQQLACDFHHHDYNHERRTVPVGITHSASGPISPKPDLVGSIYPCASLSSAGSPAAISAMEH